MSVKCAVDQMSCWLNVLSAKCPRTEPYTPNFALIPCIQEPALAALGSYTRVFIVPTGPLTRETLYVAIVILVYAIDQGQSMLLIRFSLSSTLLSV